MRIAVLSHLHFPIAEPFSGGLESHTYLMCETLAQMGHSVTLFAKAGSSVPGVRVVETIDATPWVVSLDRNDLRAVHQVQKVIDANEQAMRVIAGGNYDAIINNTLNVVPFASQIELPMLSIFHTPLITEVKNAVRENSNWSLRRYASVSKVNRGDWSAFASDIAVIHNGVDLRKWKFSANETSTPELRWSGRITPEKGLHVAIESAVIAQLPLRIAGPISDLSYYEQVIQPLLTDRVTYVGHLEHGELSRFLGSGSVAISTPLWEEPFGLATVEALASGTPVAVLPRGAMTEICKPQYSSVARDSSPQALASAIRSAMSLNRSACRSAVETSFSVGRMVDAYVALLDEMIFSQGSDASAAEPA